MEITFLVLPIIHELQRQEVHWIHWTVNVTDAFYMKTCLQSEVGLALCGRQSALSHCSFHSTALALLKSSDTSLLY